LSELSDRVEARISFLLLAYRRSEVIVRSSQHFFDHP
jgi:hypothetical protein